MSICFALVALFAALCISFMIYKTGLFFIGALLTICGCSVIGIIFLLIILNFVFNRKNNKKSMIWCFIISLILLGFGIGLIFIGSLDFEVSTYDKEIYETKELELDMRNDLLFYDDFNEIEYVEADIKNVKVEYNINKSCEMKPNEYESGIYFHTDCENGLKMVKDELRMINKKKLVALNDEVQEIKVYASKKNIEQLKTNSEEYYKKVKEVDEERKRVEEEYASNINELRKEINDLELELDNCRNNEE